MMVKSRFADFEYLVQNGFTWEFYALYQREQRIKLSDLELQCVHTYMDTFPLVEGHILAVPSKEYLSAREFPDQSYLRRDLAQIVAHQTHLYPRTDIVLFEHGNGVVEQNEVSICGELCSVQYMHIHILPCIRPHPPCISIHNTFAEYMDVAVDLLHVAGWDSVTHSDAISYSNLVFGSRQRARLPYLWLGFKPYLGSYSEATIWQESTRQFIPSQFFRRVIGTILNEGNPKTTDWNYKELMWRIFVDGYQNDIAPLRLRIENYLDRLTR